MGSHRVGHDGSDLAAAAAVIVVQRPAFKFKMRCPTGNYNPDRSSDLLGKIFPISWF